MQTVTRLPDGPRLTLIAVTQQSDGTLARLLKALTTHIN